MQQSSLYMSITQIIYPSKGLLDLIDPVLKDLLTIRRTYGTTKKAEPTLGDRNFRCQRERRNLALTGDAQQ